MSCSDSWGTPTVKLGELVREHEGRHVGVVKSWYGTKVKVLWESGAYETLEARDLTRHNMGD